MREKGNRWSLMLAGVTSLMMIVSHSSRKCCKCALASLLGKPQNWFACTIVMRLVRSSKFLVLVLIVGPTSTLATMRVE